MNHPAKIERDDDEDYVEYLGKQGAAWADNPPPVPEGFVLVPCDHEPRHWPMYTVADDDFYESQCEADHVTSLHRRISELEHAQHSRILRTKPAKKALGWLYRLGIVTGYSIRGGCGCNGCVAGIRFKGTRPYILGLPRGSWRCLRRGHTPGDPIAFGYCSKCLPCPSCGSKTAGHNPGCEEA